MSKLSYYARVIREASLEKFFEVVNQVAALSGQSKIFCCYDILRCMKKFDAGYYDYLIFQFWNLTDEQKDTYLTRFRSKKLITLVNDHNYAHIFDNKTEFNEVFKDFIGRKYIDLNKASKQEIIDFYEGRDKYFCKMQDLTCGHGAELLHKDEFKNGECFYKYVIYKGFASVEDVVENHPDIAKLYPYSANTCRVITLIGDDNEPHCLYTVFKMGNDGRVVDNFGLHSPVDMESGKIMFPCHSGDTTKNLLYTEHPYTHVPLVGYKIPMIKETVEMAKKAAMVIPQMRYVGWDIAITPNGPAIIEGNNYCAHDFWQLPGQTPGGIGMVPMIKRYVSAFSV